MPTPYDVPASALIKRLARHLKDEVYEIAPPTWAHFGKTGSHKARPPQDPDWWFARCASLLRKIYMGGPIGIARLRSEYRGGKDRGTRREHSRKGGGAILRRALKQLEAAGLVETLRNRGRVVTKEGRGLLDKLSTEVKEDLERRVPELGKY